MHSLIKTSTTAILLFNYSEKQKASLRKIAPGISAKNLAGLISKLNSKAKKVSKKSQLPFYQVDANLEQSFAVQLYDAYQNLFQQGYSQVIGISNDCPSLNEQDLEKTIISFQQHDVVLGPAKDGGLYLFGIKKNAISKAEFLNLNWQSADLYNDIEHLIYKKSLQSESLVTKADMDTVAEFKAAFNSHFEYLISFKSQLLSYCKRTFRFYQAVEIKRVSQNISLRAPPVCN